MVEQSGVGASRAGHGARAGRRWLRRVATGLVLAMMAAVLALPPALAQEQEATVANETRASASSDSEITSGDIVTGLNSGNVVATGDNHNSQVVINGGYATSPTFIDFHIYGGWSDADADAGWAEVVADGPEVGDGSALGDRNTVDNSENDNSDSSICC